MNTIPSLYFLMFYFLFSRLDAIKQLSKSACLISGMNGVGVEIAKNIILSGVRTVTLHDDTVTTLMDLST